MPSRRPTTFVPKWARQASVDRFADIPVTGYRPELSPRLPTRILPSHGESRLSASTLSDVIFGTQRIMNYVSYEVVHGIQAEFSDLRQADQGVLELAKLTVDPFEEGSFIIPASLSEADVDVDNKQYSSMQVLERFSEVMHAVEDPKTPASLGLVQAIEELGRITRREAERIEYYPTSRSPATELTIVVDSIFIDKVKRSKRERQNPTVIPDNLTGTVTAVDLVRASFNLRLDNKKTVRGKFEGLIQDRMIRMLDTRVELYGIVEYRNNNPRFIRAFSVEFLDS